jgi:dTMP kinase
MAARGWFIALEGIDGCGKTTQAKRLAESLGAVFTFEPGATRLGGFLRRLLLDPELPIVSERAEALLMAADRAQHVAEMLEPLLGAGRSVVTDRFSGSTLAYQGYGRGLELKDLERLVTWATGGLAADLSILVDVPLGEAERRRAGSRSSQDTVRAPGDRLERLEQSFHGRVRDGYLALCASTPERWAVVDGLGTPAEVADRVLAVVGEHFGSLPTPPASSGKGEV